MGYGHGDWRISGRELRRRRAKALEDAGFDMNSTATKSYLNLTGRGAP